MIETSADRCRRIATALAALSILGWRFASTERLLAQGAVAARLDGAYIVARVDPHTGTTRAVYNSSPRSVRDLTISPSGRYFAVIETMPGQGPQGLTPPPRNRLVILDTAGKQVTVSDRDVQRYTWCCLGDKVAYVVGPYYEGGVGFIPQGVWVYDVSEGVEHSLPLPRGTRAVAWAPSDSSLYVKVLARRDTAAVWRLRWPSGDVSPTDLKDIMLSPSGRYYLHYNLRNERERVGWHLIDRVSKRELPLPDTALGAVEGWAFDRGDYLILARGKHEGPPTQQRIPQAVAADVEIVEQVVYDVYSRRVAARVSGRVVPRSAAAGGSILVERSGTLQLIAPP